MWFLALLACQCKPAEPRPYVPPVERTEVRGTACYGHVSGTRVALDLSANRDIPGSVITPERTQTYQGHRKGRRIYLGPYTVELKGQILVFDPDGRGLHLKRIACP